MQKILSSAISLIISASFLTGAPVTEIEGDVNIKRMLKELKAEKDPFADSFGDPFDSDNLLAELSSSTVLYARRWGDDLAPALGTDGSVGADAVCRRGRRRGGV